MHVHPHLSLIGVACFTLAAATAYFLMVIPPRFVADDPNWLTAGASWATAFVAQCGVFVAFTCTVAAHALSGRWSWSVRLLALVSAYWGGSMAMLAVNAYEDAEKLSGRVSSPAAFLEGAMTLAAIFVLYVLFAVCTFAWVATRGRRLRFGDGVTPNPALPQTVGA